MSQSQALIPFVFDESLVRVHLDEDGNPWFVVKDVARALEYADASNPARLVAHVPEEWTGVNPFHIRSENGVVQQREILCLTEQGLYFFLARSDKPRALPFQKWLAGEVLPAIRKTGGYAMPGKPARAEVSGDIPLPPEALALRPAVREKLWSDAMQAARLDNGGSAEALVWFASLCRMMAARRPLEDAQDAVADFAGETLVRDKYSRLRIAEVYERFLVWARRNKLGTMPTKIGFGKRLSREYPIVTRGGSQYYAGAAYRE